MNIIVFFFFFTVGVRVSVTRKERSLFNKILVKNNKFEWYYILENIIRNFKWEKVYVFYEI